MFIGHKKNLNFLENALGNGSLANVYCFSGLANLGKKTLAKKIIAQVLNTEESKLFNHPDFLLVSREFDEKTEKTKKDITMEQAEKVRGFLQAKSWHNGYRTVLLTDAQFLNKTAANAILKTLEEAKDKSLIILVATDTESLPATILSRSQLINFTLVSDEEMKSGLLEMNFDSEKIDQAVKLAWGRPGRAIKLLTEANEMIFWQKEEKRWRELFDQPFYQKLGEIESLFGDKKEDHIQSRAKLINVLDLWIMLWREMLLGKNSAIKRYSGKKIIEIIDEIRKAQDLLGKNIHPRLVMENVILKFE
jgi:DNA polymerase-3 subunit delta'